MAWVFMRREGIIARRLRCRNIICENNEKKECGSEDLEIIPKLLTRGHNETEPDKWSIHCTCKKCGYKGEKNVYRLSTWVKDNSPVVLLSP